jgi:hypothetical protein
MKTEAPQTAAPAGRGRGPVPVDSRVQIFTLFATYSNAAK